MNTVATSTSQKLSIVVPCFNEAENVKLVLDQFQALMREKPYPIQVIIIDGGSTDNTPMVLRDYFAQIQNPQLKLILQTERRGYGYDIMAGLTKSDGDVLAWTHADLQTDPADVLKAFELYQSLQPAQIFIKGKRKNRRLLEAFFTFGMQIVVWFVLKTYLSDINAQPKMFCREFYKKYLKNNPPDDFSLDLFALYWAKKSGYTIKEIPVYFAKRLHGEAKGGGSWKGRISLIKRTFNYIFKLKGVLSESDKQKSI